jgi:hypothetical protein
VDILHPEVLVGELLVAIEAILLCELGTCRLHVHASDKQESAHQQQRSGKDRIRLET